MVHWNDNQEEPGGEDRDILILKSVFLLYCINNVLYGKTRISCTVIVVMVFNFNGLV